MKPVNPEVAPLAVASRRTSSSRMPVQCARRASASAHVVDVVRRLGAACAALSLAACISVNPPGPPVRWFDPRPPRAAHDRRAPLRVDAAPFLRQDFVVRTPPHEVAVDDSLRWIAPPEQLVAAALDSVAGVPDGLRVEVVRFEFERGESLRAVVELSCELAGTTRPVVGVAACASDAPEGLAAAMSAALADAVRGVVQLPK